MAATKATPLIREYDRVLVETWDEGTDVVNPIEIRKDLDYVTVKEGILSSVKVWSHTWISREESGLERNLATVRWCFCSL